MFKAMKTLNDKQLELEGKQSALESEVNRVKGTLNDIKGDLSQVIKLATEIDSKLEFIIDAKLVETVHKVKESAQKIEVSRSSVKEDTGVKDDVNEILENERRKMNIIIHNVPELDSKDRERRVDHDKKERHSIAGTINVYIHIKIIRLGKKVEEKDTLMLTELKEGTMVRGCLSNAKKLKTVDDWKKVFITPDLDKQEILRNCVKSCGGIGKMEMKI